MSSLLHINTATEHAYVCLSENKRVLGYKECLLQNQHSSFLHDAIRELLKASGKKTSNLDAVSVINGPGSYTGLRVGLSAAKGICYALDLPLICISTLEWLAYPFKKNKYDLIIPMVDARRMEVFTAVYSAELAFVSEPKALILNDQSFEEILPGNTTMFTGNGSGKLPDSIKLFPNCEVTATTSTCHEHVIIALNFFRIKQFAELAYAEPFYLKPFQSSSVK